MITEADKTNIVAFCEGNPGALRVLCSAVQLLHHNDDSVDQFFKALTELDIRGPQIWVAYKDHCDEELITFIYRVKKRNEILKTPRY